MDPFLIFGFLVLISFILIFIVLPVALIIKLLKKK